ncbi:MAG TPA: sigma-70 family RNA polymerase sigma factor [Candidatus Omnitrophota bacterium]|nr:sigma-70 family RNA polymerase sigma factor [Candidatus Omnitrophota bacterium]
MANQPSQSSSGSLDPERWVDQHGNYLYHFALGRLRNITEAENAVQETFLAALKARYTFSGKSSERTWLTGILKHKIVDTLRKHYREKPVTDLQHNEEAIDQFFDHAGRSKKTLDAWVPQPDELLERKEFWSVFHKCSEKLPKTAGDAFLLREIEKIESKEICRILGISMSNLWVLLHRARLQLRDCLEINWFVNKQN